MDIGAYLGLQKMSKKNFAKILGYSPTHFYQSFNGQRMPSVDLAFKVEEVTLGKVKAEEFIVYCIKAFKSKHKPKEIK